MTRDRLDEATSRLQRSIERLEGANREVSRRLVTAMETIRDVLSRRA